MSRFPMLGLCVCASAEPVKHILPKGEDHNGFFFLPTPETIVDESAPEGFWNVFKTGVAYRIEFTPATSPTSPGHWFNMSAQMAVLAVLPEGSSVQILKPTLPILVTRD